MIQNQKDDYSLDDLSKQFNKEDEKKAVLIIDTVFGKKSFYLSEIKSVVLENGDGSARDITHQILK